MRLPINKTNKRTIMMKNKIKRLKLTYQKYLKKKERNWE
jgi:hypothetical protein